MSVIFYSDISKEYAFAMGGVPTKAIVTGESYMVLGGRVSASERRYPLPQVAFDYSYSVDSKHYDNHVLNNHIHHNKGDVIDIEYLRDDPAISCYIGDKKRVSDIGILISICAGLMIIGFIMVLWPTKLPPPDGEQEVDWSEYERTHE